MISNTSITCSNQLWTQVKSDFPPVPVFKLKGEGTGVNIYIVCVSVYKNSIRKSTKSCFLKGGEERKELRKNRGDEFDQSTLYAYM
jgi:hypothetical protein